MSAVTSSQIWLADEKIYKIGLFNKDKISAAADEVYVKVFGTVKVSPSQQGKQPSACLLMYVHKKCMHKQTQSTQDTHTALQTVTTRHRDCK